jgi:hypothetical protein
VPACLDLRQVHSPLLSLGHFLEEKEYMVSLRAVKAKCKEQIDVCLLNDDPKAVAVALRKLSVLVSFGKIKYDAPDKHAPSYVLGRSLCPFQVLQIVKALFRDIDSWSVVKSAYMALFDALVADIKPSTGNLADLESEQESEAQSKSHKKTIVMAIVRVDRQRAEKVAARIAAIKPTRTSSRSK